MLRFLLNRPVSLDFQPYNLWLAIKLQEVETLQYVLLIQTKLPKRMFARACEHTLVFKYAGREEHAEKHLFLLLFCLIKFDPAACVYSTPRSPVLQGWAGLLGTWETSHPWIMYVELVFILEKWILHL